MRFSEFFLISLLLLCVTSTGCDGSEGKGTRAPYESVKGAMTTMKNHKIGRFSFSIPAEMSTDARTARLREIEIIDFRWPNGSDKDTSRAQVWNKHIQEINKLAKPRDVKDILMEQRSLIFSNRWSKGVYYYGNSALNDEGFWDVLIDAGETGVWLKFHGLVTAKEEMLRWVSTVASTYREGNNLNNLSGDFFCLKHGVLNIPYKHQESTYSRFTGHPLDLTLEIEMSETYKDEPKGEGLLARAAAAILTGFCLGVDIHKIRSRDRKVAGLDGEEQVVRMKDKDGTELDFTWRYAGKKDSGEYPKIVVTMESSDGNLENKLKVWDAILDSMKPLYKQPPGN